MWEVKEGDKLLLIISPLSLSLSLSLSNMAGKGKKGAELLWVGGLSQTREQNRIDSLFKRLKERETNCKKRYRVFRKNMIIYL